MDINKNRFYLFGNKGDVFAGTAHIAKSGLHSTTLCGKPMLSSNWVRIEGVAEPGCSKCIEFYKTLNG
jgi:hypothetical protein